MYNSPIRTAVMHSDITAKVNEDVDGLILSSVVRCGVSVDKEELLRALKYDRGQYDAGYRDGMAAAEKKLVRCEKCKGWDEEEKNPYNNHCRCNRISVIGYSEVYTASDGYCHLAERRDDDA